MRDYCVRFYGNDIDGSVEAFVCASDSSEAYDKAAAELDIENPEQYECDVNEIEVEDVDCLGDCADCDGCADAADYAEDDTYEVEEDDLLEV